MAGLTTDLNALFQNAVDAYEAVFDICFHSTPGLPAWIGDPSVRLISTRSLRAADPPCCIYFHPTEGYHAFMVSMRQDGRASWVWAPYPSDWRERLAKRREHQARVNEARS